MAWERCACGVRVTRAWEAPLAKVGDDARRRALVHDAAFGEEEEVVEHVEHVARRLVDRRNNGSPRQGEVLENAADLCVRLVNYGELWHI